MSIITEYVKDFNAAPKPRNLIVCMDGTWNDEDGENGNGVITNVAKLYKTLDADSESQVSRYFRGVGNDDDNNRLGKLFGGAFGQKEKSIRDNAYSTIVKEYQSGDNIYIFGFSRGAASARMLASQLQKEGIREKITITTEAKANEASNHVENCFVSYETSGKQKDVNVSFLGVWDTVGAFGIPVTVLGIPFQKWNLFHDMDVSSNIKKAVHLVSIDETRTPFEPTLMNHKPGVVEEVWFAGVHSDVGGGYEEDELGRITFRFMVGKINDHVKQNKLPAIKFHQQTLDKYIEQTSEEINFHFHGLGYKKAIRDIHILENGEPSNTIKPGIHKSVFDLQQSSEVFSLVKNKTGKTKYSIQYNPMNLKKLTGKYIIIP